MTSVVVAKSSDNSAGRMKGTSAPQAIEISAISWSSVLTKTWSNNCEFIATSIDHAIIGLP